MRKIVAAKLLVGGVLAATLLAVLGALLYLQFNVLLAPSHASEHRVVVVAPGGRSLFNGTLVIPNGTPLSALEAAGKAAGFPIVVRSFPTGSFVESVNGTAARGDSGWMYFVRHDQTWSGVSRAADQVALADGDAVAWVYGKEGMAYP